MHSGDANPCKTEIQGAMLAHFQNYVSRIQLICLQDAYHAMGWSKRCACWRQHTRKWEMGVTEVSNLVPTYWDAGRTKPQHSCWICPGNKSQWTALQCSPVDGNWRSSQGHQGEPRQGREPQLCVREGESIHDTLGQPPTDRCISVVSPATFLPLRAPSLGDISKEGLHVAWQDPLLGINSSSDDTLGCPDGPVVKDLPCNAGDSSSIPSPGWSHMLWGSWALEPILSNGRVAPACSNWRKPRCSKADPARPKR